MRRGALQEKRERLMNLGISEPVVILQDQVDLVINVRQVVHQRRDNRARIDQEALPDQVDRRRAYPLARALQGVSDIEEKGRGLVVVRIDGEPRDRIAALLQPLEPGHGQRGLAEPRRSLEDGQALCRKLSGKTYEPWTFNQPRASRRHDLGGEERKPFPAER